MRDTPTYWLPQGINPPCTCAGHHHRQDDEAGHCEYPIDNDPESWGYCTCQHKANEPVTMDKYQRWQADIRAGRITPDDKPSDLGLNY